MRRLLAILAVLWVSLSASPQVVHAGAHTYDTSSIERVGVQQVNAAEAVATLRSDVREGSASRALRTPRSARTPSGTLVATNALRGLDDAAFAQTTFRESFSAGGTFAGQTIDDVAAGLRSGALSPGDVPIQVIVRDGNTLILNTRSAQALTRAEIPRSDWLTVNVTGNAAAEARLTAQLARNGLDSTGFFNPLSTGK